MNKFLKALFVEDIEDDAQLLLRELKKGGYNLTYRRVETAEQMSEALRSDVWDVIIADYNLPNFSGPEALMLLKESGVDIPFIAVSGSIGEDNAVEILKKGAHDFITKTNLSRLVPAIEREVEEFKIRKAHKQAEEALQQSEKRYQTLAQISPVGIFRTDAMGYTTYVNPRWCQITGLSADDALGYGWLEAVHIDDREKLSKSWTEALQNHKEAFSEYRIVRPDGTVAWVMGQAVPEKNFQNQAIAYVGTITDITARKLAEEALRESEKRYRTLFDSSPVSLWEEDLSDIKRYIDTKKTEGVDDFDSYFDNNPDELIKCIGLLKILDINESTLKLYKAESKSDLLQGLMRTSSVETLKDFKRSILAVAAGKSDFHTETENYTLDGKKLYLNVSWKVLPGYEDNYGRAIVSIADITDIKLAEEEIKTTNEELKILNKVILESASYLDIQHILENALDEALRITNLEGGTICLINPDNTFSLAAHRATSEANISDLSSKNIKVGDCLCGNCATEKCPLILWTREEVLRYSTREILRGDEIRFHAAFPIVIKDKAQGVLCVFTRTDAKPTKRSLKLLETITSQMSLSLENAKLYEQSQNQVVTLQNLTEQFRLLAERLRTAREDERIGIAREIHDELGQVLTALKIDLTLFQNKLSKRNNFFKKDLEGIISLVDSIIKTVQKISTELRPAVLDDLGLNAAIEWQVWEFQNRTGIIFDVSKIEDIGKLERHTATALFRIFQEALTNIARHSAASKVEIVMKRIDSDIFLEIHDNGSGITTEKIENKNSIGILGMRERAIALGGEFMISGSPGIGTVVTVRIPGGNR